MNVDLAPMALPLSPQPRTMRADAPAGSIGRLSDLTCLRLLFAVLALGFVVLGGDGLDVGPGEGRLGLAASGAIGPLGQVFGYWAPDLWPGEVLPSMLVSHLSQGSRANSGVVRWPAVIAALLGGWILTRGVHRTLGVRAGILTALCWLGSWVMIDRSTGGGLDMIVAMFTGSAGGGLDLILGVATLAAIARLLGRGADVVAGIWASLAFLAGGWPPLLLIFLTIIVIGRRGSYFSAALVLPPLATAAAWSVLTIRVASVQAWASALGLPLTRSLEWSLAPGLLVLGLPWIPFAFLAWSRALRETWPAAGRAWVRAWVQVAAASAIAGTFVPGLGPAARVVSLAGLAVAAGAVLDGAWKRALTGNARRAFYGLFSLVLAGWLIVMICGCFVWIVSMPYYRTLGIVMALILLGAAGLGWSGLGSGNTRRCLVTLIILAAGVKLVHWGYYAPEWNYRFSQGPWGRAVGQWIPRKWPLYTFHDWPSDLAFFVGRPVRQLRSPRFLNYLPGRECRFVLLQASELENWPENAPPVTPVARFQDQAGAERVLARTPGIFPSPGQEDPSAPESRSDRPLASAEAASPRGAF